MTKKIYISGPITHNKVDYEKRFKDCKERLQKEYPNYEIVNPLDFGEDSISEEEKWSKDSWKIYIHKDIDLVWTCDVIYLMKGWELSFGCFVELTTAIRKGCKVLREEPTATGDYFLENFRYMRTKLCSKN